MGWTAAVKWWVLACLHTCLEWVLAVVFGTVVLTRLVFAFMRGAVRDPRVRDAPPPCLEHPDLGRHKFLKLQQNVKLHYVEAGNPEAQLVVMLHGAPDFWFTWRKQITTLSLDFCVVALDLRGCGDSDAPSRSSQYATPIVARDVASLITVLGRDKAHLVCAGQGGQVGWYLSYHYPQLVSKMVLIHAPHPYVIRQYINTRWANYLKSWYLYFVRLPYVPELAAHVSDNGMIDQMFSPLVAAKAITEDEIEAYKFTFSRREDWRGPLNHLRQMDLSKVVKEEPLPDVITKPTLLLMGEADPALPMDLAYRSAEYVERITVRQVKGRGHLAHVSQAPQVNEAIGEFLREMPWRPLSPLEEKSSSSLVRRVMGASLAAVTSTVNKTTGALEMTTRGLPIGFKTMAQGSIKLAESKLGLEYDY
ncbi:epoxide hydrolase 4-like isoform X1 [Eriocheir sinensis]|uniref:epoxide hydrolase 4-like isoform X1 n=1 Tax=Eriocheir sinensis TaxID=95602 RepID=UPI0021C78A5B|nr:epoxide hydrolase 4-like isoform X1 [Eriocheir sinensis]XP_050732402.1 epoxide hydrolase 4-like isoform X1 [Eriocheir sinensis]